MFKFIHAADLHLDSPLRGLDTFDGCPADEIRGASRRAVENLVTLAIREQVRFVLVAGDVYDGEWKDHNTGLWFARKMADLKEAGIAVILIKGNHDAESKIPSHLRLTDNVNELPTDKPATIYLDDWNVAVHGQGFKTPKVLENLAEAYPAAERGWFNVGLLHTCAGGVEGHERYSPCSIETMRSRRFGYDYWALGHIHKREILNAENPFVAFSGNIQGRHIRESGPKGCLLVTVHENQVKTVSFRALDVFRWEICKIDASGAEDGDAIIERCGDHLRKLVGLVDDRPLAVRVEVAGPTRAHRDFSAKLGGWLDDLRRLSIEIAPGKIWIEQLKARTTEPTSLSEETTGALAELTQVIDELRADPIELKRFVEEELASLTKKIGRALRDPAELMGINSESELTYLLDSTLPMLRQILETS